MHSSDPKKGIMVSPFIPEAQLQSDWQTEAHPYFCNMLSELPIVLHLAARICTLPSSPLYTMVPVILAFIDEIHAK